MMADIAGTHRMEEGSKERSKDLTTWTFLKTYVKSDPNYKANNKLWEIFAENKNKVNIFTL